MKASSIWQSKNSQWERNTEFTCQQSEGFCCLSLAPLMNMCTKYSMVCWTGPNWWYSATGASSICYTVHQSCLNLIFVCGFTYKTISTKLLIQTKTSDMAIGYSVRTLRFAWQLTTSAKALVVCDQAEHCTPSEDLQTIMSKVSSLAGALSPVNHKGLHHGWTQTSLYLPQRITSWLNTNFTLSPSHSFHKSSHHKSFSWAYFYSNGYSTQEPASRRVTFFTLRAYTGTGVSHSQHRKKLGAVLEKNAGEWTGRVEISKEETPGSKCSMYGYILTYSRL